MKILLPMHLSGLLESGLTAESLALIRLIKVEAERLNFPLYIVGGSVRDLILGRAIKDFDITVEGNSGVLAEFVMKRYGGHIVVHSRFGTATWTLNESTFKRLNIPAFQSADSRMSFDLISARAETYASPGALPIVKYSNIMDDLKRRDFTINAMAIRLDGAQYGDLYDPLSGYDDVARKLIRVLHPKSFVDDPTRMFRAVRYAQRYGFNLEQDTKDLINDEARGVLSQLSGERIRNEFDLIFEENNPSAILMQLGESGLLSVVYPSLAGADSGRLSQLVDRPDDEFGEFSIPDILTFKQALSWVLCLMNLPENEIDSIGLRLAFPALLTKAVKGASVLGRNLSSSVQSKPSYWTFHLDDIPPLGVLAVYLIRREQALKDYLTTWRHVKPYTTGYTLQQRGLQPGPRYKEILSRLRVAWLDGEIQTEDEEMRLLGSLLR